MQHYSIGCGMLLVLLSGVVSARAAGDPNLPPGGAADLDLSIAVPLVNGVRPIFLTGPGAHFHVVLLNRAQSPLRIWREGNSWGHAALRFEGIDAEGKPFVIRRRAVPFLQNAPSYQVLEPGGTFVVDVLFADDSWQTFPLPAKGGLLNVALQAIYEVPLDMAAKQHGVWTGKIASPLETYRFEDRQ